MRNLFIMTLEHPAILAKEIARLLESDRIASSQVQDWIEPAHLYEILELEAPVEPLEQDFTEILAGVPKSEILAYAIARHTKSEILAALK